MSRSATAPGEIVSIERTLPHNLEAERMVLGAILLDNSAYERAGHHLRPADFFRDAHRRIFKSIARLLEKPGGLVELVTLKNDLAKNGDLDEVGGPAYITALVDGLPRSTNIEHYAGMVREKALYRDLILASSKTLTAAYAEEGTAAEVLASADKRLIDLQRGEGAQLVDLATSSGSLMNDLDYRIQHRGELFGVDTGFKSINDLTYGWQAGDMVVVAARPSIGKTTFVVNSMTALARTGKTVALFSMEMKRQQLEYRILSSLSGVPLSRLLGGYLLGQAELQAVTAAIEIMHTCGVHIDDGNDRTIVEIRGECRRLKADRGLALVAIDYVQLMPGTLERRGSTRNEEVTDISRKLKALAGELGVPIIVVSQLNRRSKDRADPRPKLEDLRESGSLEQDADLVCFLHRKQHREGGVTNFIIEKQRNGPTGTVNLTLDRDITLFVDGGEEPAPKPEEEQAEKKERQRKMFARRAHAR